MILSLRLQYSVLSVNYAPRLGSVAWSGQGDALATLAADGARLFHGLSSSTVLDVPRGFGCKVGTHLLVLFRVQGCLGLGFFRVPSKLRGGTSFLQRNVICATAPSADSLE